MSAQTIQTPDQQALARTLAAIGRLGLNDNLIELDAQGYTVVRDVLSANQVDRAKAAILKRVEARIGKPVDPDRVTEEDFQSPMGTSLDHVGYLLYDDPVFEEILVAEKPLALVSYLVGESCLVSSISCFFKGPGPTGVLPLHADTLGPQPFPTYAQTANVNYALTPYSRKGGATAIVPGSHRRARQPSFSEMALGGDQANPEAVPLDMAPGDCAVWHGHTWHGSYERQVPGIRMNLAHYFARHHVAVQERHRGEVPPEVLERHANDARFRRLLGLDHPYGWAGEGPDAAKMMHTPTGWYD